MAKFTSAQRTRIKMAKLNQSAAKSAINEVGKTIRNVTGQITAAATTKNVAAAQLAKEAQRANNASISEALAKYYTLMDGNPDKETGASGTTQDAATTEIGGGSNSYLGG